MNFSCVIIQIKGKDPEGLLNAARKMGIPLWDASRTGKGEMTVRLRAGDFPKLRPACRQARVRVHILRKGRLAVLGRLLRRRTLLISMFFIAGVLALLSTRILVIQITGLNAVPESVIQRALEEQGVYFMAPRKGFDSFRVSTKARVYDQRIASMSVDLDGVRCRVEVCEAVPGVETIDWSVPTDVVAVKDGVIKSIAPLDGKAMVGPGDAVSAGDVLIAGNITSPEADHPLLVHARGEVLAIRCYASQCVVLPLARAMVDTGNTAPYRCVLVAGRAMYETADPYDNSEIREIVRTGPYGTLLPIYLVTGSYYELAEGQVTRSREEMIGLALSCAESGAYAKVPTDARIDDKTAAWWEREGGAISGVCVITAEESIGVIKEITD